MKRITLLACSVLGILAISPRPLGQVFSDFSVSDEAWIMIDLPDGGPFTTPLATYTPVYVPSGGNPGGHLSFDDPSEATYYFQAPAKYLGNQSAVLGGSLSYDVKAEGIGARLRVLTMDGTAERWQFRQIPTPGGRPAPTAACPPTSGGTTTSSWCLRSTHP